MNKLKVEHETQVSKQASNWVCKKKEGRKETDALEIAFFFFMF